MRLMSKPEYLEELDRTRDTRMSWWREARFGMFIHLGLYSVLGRGEWAMAREAWSVADYEKLAGRFTVRPDAAEQWAELAVSAGMRYMVLTTRHHEGFSLWDSKANPYNSVNLGPRRDIVREFVEACRARNLRIGLYSSLMDWHHPDGGKAAYDSAARKRFQEYIYALNEELLTHYGKIDILWYDAPCPMEHQEGWNSLEMNQRLRALQPEIIINDRSLLPEDFGTPEENLNPREKRDWEACMTFNGISWGYVDSQQAVLHSFNAQRILKLLAGVSGGGGNLLLNIGPTAEGDVPLEVVEPLKAVGRWLNKNGECVYGKLDKNKYADCIGVTCAQSVKGRTLYLWNWIWPSDGEIVLGGFRTKLRSVRYVESGAAIDFTQTDWRIRLKNLPKSSPDLIAGVTILALEFDEDISYTAFPCCSPLNSGRTFDLFTQTACV